MYICIYITYIHTDIHACIHILKVSGSYANVRAYAEALRFFDTLFLGTDFRFVDGIKVDDIRVFMYAYMHAGT